MTDTPGLYRPDWRLPEGVHAFVTTRQGGVSRGPWESFNLGLHVGDAPAAVQANRARLEQALSKHCAAPAPAVQWIRQVHGTVVLRAGDKLQVESPKADAIHGESIGIALGVLTADCLPVLFCADDGSEIAVAHAGWRGLLAGVLEATLDTFRTAPSAIRTWLGPAIGPCHFEVGEEVRMSYLARAPAPQRDAIAAAFQPTANPHKWLADLYRLAHIRLSSHGVAQIEGEPVCTCCNNRDFYSYRIAPVTGRFATLILKSA